jgi:hypothetical protein
MSGMKKIMALTSMAMALHGLSGPSNINGGPTIREYTPQEKAELLRRRKERKDQIKLERGLKSFRINGKIYWARTEEKARRKADNDK